MRVLLFAAMLCVPFSLFAQETWYGFCKAVKEGTRYCSEPELKTEDTKEKCRLFALEHSTYRYQLQYSTSLSHLRSTLPSHCDVVEGDANYETYACMYATLCPNGPVENHHLASRTFASDERTAMERCFEQNYSKLTSELKKQSSMGCFLKLYVEKMTDY